MSDTILTIVAAIIGSSTLSTIVQIFIARSDAKKKAESEEAEVSKEVMEALAHDAYFRQARYLLLKDSITKEELDNHKFLYRAYHSLGLNSTGDRMHEIILDMPIDIGESLKDIKTMLP